MNKDLVYLVWTDVNTEKKYKVAELYKENGKYYFKYILENVEEAKKHGFSLLVAFPKIDETYENTKLFVIESLSLPRRLTGDVYAELRESVHVHVRQNHGGMHFAPAQIFERLHGFFRRRVGRRQGPRVHPVQARRPARHA